MSVTIDSELVTFRDKISPILSSGSQTISTLSSKLDDINSCSESAVTSLSACYKGEGLNSCVSSFNSIKAAVEGIKATFAEGPEQVISLSTVLVEDINKLEELKKEIDALEEEISKMERWSYKEDKSNKVAVDTHNRSIDNKESEKSTKETKFNSDQEKCKSSLAAIKAINPEIDISVKEQVVELGSGEVMVDLKTLKPGSYQTLSYTAKNGRTINYSIYVPANADTTTGLPVHVYMGGSGEVGKMNAGGLPKLLSEGQQSTGIVIVLEADYHNAYEEGNYLDASKELIDNVVTTYKADTNRISVSGHSLGGIGTLHMAERFPGYFSVVAPVSGYNNRRGKQSSSTEEAYEKLKNENIVAITGRSDTNSYNSMNVLNTKLKDGGNMQFITIPGGHRIQFKVYGEEVTVNGKTYANWLEFCLAQTKTSSTTA